MVGILVAGFDRLCMYDLGHDLVPKMMVECRNGMKQRCLGIAVGGSKGFSIGKAKKKAG